MTDTNSETGRKIMRLTPFLITVSLIILSSIILVRIIDIYLLPLAVHQSDPTYEVQDSTGDLIIVQEDANPSIPGTETPVVVQVSNPMDAQSLIESHCIECHMAQWLEEVEKPRSEWVMILEQMEKMGVHLNNAEKGVLLDTLAWDENP
jgi:hypothetical protein